LFVARFQALPFRLFAVHGSPPKVYVRQKPFLSLFWVLRGFWPTEVSRGLK